MPWMYYNAIVNEIETAVLGRPADARNHSEKLPAVSETSVKSVKDARIPGRKPLS